MKVRDGNDFVFDWAIERGGVAEDISISASRKLLLRKYREVREITEYEITGDNNNILYIEFTPDVYWGIGSYNLELHYELPDVTLADGNRKCAVDLDAFTIVPETALADESSELSATSDIALALRGKNAYEVWLETHEGDLLDYDAWLRQPAIDAAVAANTAAGLANTKAGEAHTAAQAANTAAGLADAARLAIQNDLAKKIESEPYSETEYNEV